MVEGIIDERDSYYTYAQTVKHQSKHILTSNQSFIETCVYFIYMDMYLYGNI